MRFSRFLNLWIMLDFHIDQFKEYIDLGKCLCYIHWLMTMIFATQPTILRSYNVIIM